MDGRDVGEERKKKETLVRLELGGGRCENCQKEKVNRLAVAEDLGTTEGQRKELEVNWMLEGRTNLRRQRRTEPTWDSVLEFAAWCFFFPPPHLPVVMEDESSGHDLNLPLWIEDQW